MSRRSHRRYGAGQIFHSVIATWLITEAEQQPDGDWMLYGYCTLGYEWEWGTVMLSELQALRGPFGLTTERDLYIGNNATVAELAY